jgi:DNA-binding XRE family transcriptional regulator
MRLAAGLTQVEAGELIGVRGQSVSQVERGELGMRWTTLLRYLAVYGSDLEGLAVELRRRKR